MLRKDLCNLKYKIKLMPKIKISIYHGFVVIDLIEQVETKAPVFPKMVYINRRY
jgi:hypothetical protein